MADGQASAQQIGILAGDRDVMNRRGFLGSLIGGVAAAAAVRTFPFRVFSFPAEVVPATISEYCDFATTGPIYYNKQVLQILAKQLNFRAAQSINGSFYGIMHPKRAIEIFRYQQNG